LDAKKIKRILGRAVDGIFLLDNHNPARSNPSWKFRRKLIFGSYRLAFAMIAFGAVTFYFDTSVSNTLISGGVALISIIVSAYVAGSAYEDVRLDRNKHKEP
jgi:fructose-1,6-bisphosphatase/inositol monophosphatase family enzyme